MNGIKSKYSGCTTKILIVDDNPIPTIKMVETLLLNFSNKVFWNEFTEDELPQFKEWNELKKEAENNNCYKIFYGKYFNFISVDKLISIYIYNPLIGTDENENIIENNKRIAEILSLTNYTNIWMDSGHSAVKIIPDEEISINENNKTKINKYGGGHSASIITKNNETAQIFMQSVDTAAVYQNASTRFTDGGQFGLGGELAISTDKLHHRGPMGLQHLVTNKWYIFGDGQIR